MPMTFIVYLPWSVAGHEAAGRVDCRYSTAAALGDMGVFRGQLCGI